MEAKANDARQVLIKFNKQMEPIYAILRDVEQYTLSQEILEPKLEGEDSNDSLAPNGASASGAQGATEGGNRVITVDLGADVNFDPADKSMNQSNWFPLISEIIILWSICFVIFNEMIERKGSLDRHAAERLMRNLISYLIKRKFELINKRTIDSSDVYND